MIFRIQYIPLSDSLTQEQMIEFSNEVAREHAKALAEEVRDTFSNWLSKHPDRSLGAKTPIGASGRSSRNFKIEEETRRGVSTWYVRETGAPANKFIREGIPPGTTVSLSKLKMWLANKGFDVLSYSDYKKKMGMHTADPSEKWTYGHAEKISGYSSTSKKGNPFTAKGYARSGRDQKSIVNSALMAIKNVLEEEGTENRPNANWFPYYPSSYGKFDYPAYLAVARRVMLERILSRHSDATAHAMVSYWNSAGRVRVWDWKMKTTRHSNKKKGDLFF